MEGPRGASVPWTPSVPGFGAGSRSSRRVLSVDLHVVARQVDAEGPAFAGTVPHRDRDDDLALPHGRPGLRLARIQVGRWDLPTRDHLDVPDERVAPLRKETGPPGPPRLEGPPGIWVTPGNGRLHQQRVGNRLRDHVGFRRRLG